MRIGTRVVHPDEVDRWAIEIVQISVYRGMKDNIAVMRQCASRCRKRGLPYVVHPVGFAVLTPDDLEILEVIATDADFGMILHDERMHNGERLSQDVGERYRGLLRRLSRIAPVSLENSDNSGDILWFWEQFASSLTLDIGHLEAAGIDSLAFVGGLDLEILRRIEHVHLHRNNGLHGGITDHWPLTSVCRELDALKILLGMNSGVNVILEINETNEISDSLNILGQVKRELGL